MTPPTPLRIDFQGRALPPFASLIDVAGCVEGVDEETALWLWHFVICAGLTKSASSAVVLKHVGCMRRMFELHADAFLNEIAKRLPSADPKLVLAEWEKAVCIMGREASSSDECRWSGSCLGGSSI